MRKNIYKFSHPIRTWVFFRNLISPDFHPQIDPHLIGMMLSHHQFKISTKCLSQISLCLWSLLWTLKLSPLSNHTAEHSCHPPSPCSHEHVCFISCFSKCGPRTSSVDTTWVCQVVKKLSLHSSLAESHCILTRYQVSLERCSTCNGSSLEGQRLRRISTLLGFRT